MKEEEVVEMLRHYRHDWLNDLQLILGYAQLGKLDRIQSKITDIMERSVQERGFDQLNIPKTMLWLYQLNWRSDSFFLDFQFLVDEHPVIIDDALLLTHIQKVFQILSFYQKEYQSYHGIFIVKQLKQEISIYITFDSEWNHTDDLKKELAELSFIQQITIDDQLKITWKENDK